MKCLNFLVSSLLKEINYIYNIQRRKVLYV